jgi:hypothetical protein
MSTASGWDDPAFDPPHFEPDPDLERDLFVERVDRGEQCPACRRTGPMTITEQYGLPVFTCTCRTSWYDYVTRPTLEAA